MTRKSSKPSLLFCLLLGSFVSLAGLPSASGQVKLPVIPDAVDASERDLVQEIDALKAELQWLRQRDAARTTWEQSLSSRLSDNGIQLLSEGYQLPTASGIQQCGCGELGCTEGCTSCGCQCPLPEAPCIECPRVSTLRPHFNVSIFGALKLDAIFNRARPLSPGVPFLLLPDSPVGRKQDTVSLHARQSTFGAAVSGPEFCGLKAGGTAIVMFFNDGVIVDQYGLLPLQAFGELRNEDWRFAAGLQFDIFSPGIPTVLPFSALGASGNAGNSFRGQIRLERFFRPSDESQFTVQVGISDPINSTIDPTFRLSEDNGWPNVEARVAVGLGALDGAGPLAKRPFEWGISGVTGEIRTTLPGTRVVAEVQGLSTDFRWQISECFGVQGELFTGQTLGTYNGGILQNINPTTLEGVRSSGGFLEAFCFLTPCLHTHIGYGIDDPRDEDVDPAPASLGRTRNETWFANLLWDLNDAFRVGFEFTWRETDYLSPLIRDNEGPGFHGQFQWTF